ncbi:MAG: helix-turn-helix transcriptional regulator [Planctomycetia bacterium]
MIHPLWTHRTAEPASPPLGEDAPESQLMCRALQVIAADACRGLRVQELADRLGVSRRCLAKWFPRTMGCSPHEAIQRAVFDEVEKLLVTSDLRLADVAARTGFRHAEYLTVAFTRRYGVAPSEWRQRQRAASLHRVLP